MLLHFISSSVTAPEPESIQCFTCENTFENSWNLLQHLTDKHNLNLYRDASDDGLERRGPQTPSPIPSEEVRSEQNAVSLNEIAEEAIKEEILIKNEDEEENELLA